MMRKSDAGKSGTFHGYDGKLYRGHIERVAKGYAVIHYCVPTSDCRVEEIVAYLPRAAYERFVIGEDHFSC